MKIKCQETESFLNTSTNFTNISKGMESILLYIKEYLEKTNEYVDKLKTLNTKSNVKSSSNSNTHLNTINSLLNPNNQNVTTNANNPNSKQKKPHLSPIEEFFRRLKIIVNAQITSLNRFNSMVNSEIKKCEQILQEQIECQKKFKKEAIEAEGDYQTQLREIDQAKRDYYQTASSLEDELRSFEKKRRGSFKYHINDDWVDNINEAIRNMVKAEKDYSKKLSKSHRFKQTFIERVLASTGSSQQLNEEIEKNGKEVVVNTMLYLKMAGKEMSTEIDTYSLDMNKPIRAGTGTGNGNEVLIDNGNGNGNGGSGDWSNTQSTIECLSDLVMEPYKIRLLTQDQSNDDFSEEEIHNVIKTMYENMKQKAYEYDIDFEGKKVKMNTVIKKLLSFPSDLRITKDDQQLIDKFITEKKLREAFLQKLNDLRNTGDFNWPKEHYNEVGRILKLILDHISKDKANEIETAKNVVILSQTFYFKNSNGTKVYLQSYIQDHALFKQKEFWENIMLTSIERELNDYTETNKKQKIFIKETEEDTKMKLSNIVFSQVVPLTDNMVGFNIPNEDIRSILDNVFAKHRIDESHKELVMSVLEKDGRGGNSSGKSQSSKMIEENNNMGIRDEEDKNGINGDKGSK